MKKLLVTMMVLALLLSLPAFADGSADKLISAGYDTSYIVKNDGTLWGWGNGFTGNNNGYKVKQIEPVKILDDVKSVLTNFLNTIAVKKDGTLWGWGAFDGYPFGAAEAMPERHVPTKMMDNVTMAACGGNYVTALKDDQSLWICGNAGNGTTDFGNTEVGFIKVTDDVKYVATAPDTNGIVLYIKNDNTLWGYGYNGFAIMGDVLDDENYASEWLIEPVKIVDDIKQFAVTTQNILAIKLDGSLYGWGRSGFYSSQGYIEEATQPYHIADDVVACDVNDDKGVFIKKDGTLWSWGESYQGKEVDTESLYQITDHVKDVSLGYQHMLILKDDKSIWTAGRSYGLGYKTGEEDYQPLKKIIGNTAEKTSVKTDINSEDAPASWAKEEVERAIANDLIPLSMQSKYAQPITREEFCVLAIKMIEVREGKDIDDILAERGLQKAPANTFTDCDNPSVLAAKTLGITDGVGGGKFAPSNQLTREQAAKFLSTTAKACGKDITAEAPQYKDLNEIASWAQPYTGYVYNIGVMKGVGEGNFAPQASYQRQQAFMTMQRILDAMGTLSEVDKQNIKDNYNAVQPADTAKPKGDSTTNQVAATAVSYQKMGTPISAQDFMARADLPTEIKNDLTQNDDVEIRKLEAFDYKKFHQDYYNGDFGNYTIEISGHSVGEDFVAGKNYQDNIYYTLNTKDGGVNIDVKYDSSISNFIYDKDLDVTRLIVGDAMFGLYQKGNSIDLIEKLKPNFSKNGAIKKDVDVYYFKEPNGDQFVCLHSNHTVDGDKTDKYFSFDLNKKIVTKYFELTAEQGKKHHELWVVDSIAPLKNSERLSFSFEIPENATIAPGVDAHQDDADE